MASGGKEPEAEKCASEEALKLSCYADALF